MHALHRDLPTMGGDDPVHQIQPEPGPRLALRGATAKVFLKKPLEFVGWDAFALVTHSQVQHSIRGP